MQILQRYFDALRSHDWVALGECLSEQVHRTGPFMDVVQGRQAYLDFLAGIVPTLENYVLTLSSVHRLDGGSALALLTETLDVDGTATRFPEALHFGFDEAGRILRIDVFIQDPTRNPARTGSGEPAEEQPRE